MNRGPVAGVVPSVPVHDPCEDPHGGATDTSPYRGGVLKPVRPAALRWVFLVALALGIVGMHHLPMSDTGQEPVGHTMSVIVASAPSVEAAPACCDSMGDMMHLCLAVLCAAAALLLSWLLLRRRATTWPPRPGTAGATSSGRSPPPRRPVPLLPSLCVLRL
jgi:hypothetical protein